MKALVLAALLAATAPLAAQTTDPTAFASAADVKAQVAAMAKALKPGQHFAWQPLARDGVRVAAIEYWTAPGRPAIHPDQAEYTIVIAGAGTLVSGGTMTDQSATHPDLIEGSKIEGGTTRALKTGDVILIPAGTPHWFGITGGKLVLLGIKLPSPAAAR